MSTMNDPVPSGSAATELDDVPEARRALLSIDVVLGKRIVKLAAPVVAAMLTQTFINQADHILVGRLPIEEATPGQGALLISLMLLWAVGGALSAISVGTQAITARRLGAGKPVEAGQVLTNSLGIAVTLGALASVVCALLAPVIFPLISKDPEVVRLGVPFVRWRFLAILPMVVSMSYKSHFDGLGKTWVHMAAAIVMNVVNLGLNIGLIFGKWGMPRMGVEGSGLASCIASYMGALMMMGWSFLPEMRRKFRYYRLAAFDKDIAKEIGTLSWPSGIAVIFAMVGFIAFMVAMGFIDRRAGNEHAVYLSASSNLINIFMVIFIGGQAYATATATLVGQSMGAKRFALAESYVYEALKIGVLVFGAVGLIAVAQPEHVLRIWTHDPAVIEVARPMLRVLGMMCPVAVTALVFTFALYGAGNPRFVMVVELILHFGCLVPMSFVLGLVLHLGFWGAWSAMIAYIVLLAGIMAAKFSTGTWKSIQI